MDVDLTKTVLLPNPTLTFVLVRHGNSKSSQLSLGADRYYNENYGIENGIRI